jgi:hypothetical protein
VFVQAVNCIHFAKRPNLKFKTRPKQLLGSLPLAFELPTPTLAYKYFTRVPMVDSKKHSAYFQPSVEFAGKARAY